KNGDRSANSESKILYSPGITHRNNPLATRNKPTTKYPTGEEKKAFISLRNIASILRFVFSSLILEDCLHSKPLVCREKELLFLATPPQIGHYFYMLLRLLRTPMCYR